MNLKVVKREGRREREGRNEGEMPGLRHKLKNRKVGRGARAAGSPEGDGRGLSSAVGPLCTESNH